jgi:hypothetical protein
LLVACCSGFRLQGGAARLVVLRGGKHGALPLSIIHNGEDGGEPRRPRAPGARGFRVVRRREVAARAAFCFRLAVARFTTSCGNWRSTCKPVSPALAFASSLGDDTRSSHHDTKLSIVLSRLLYVHQLALERPVPLLPLLHTLTNGSQCRIGALLSLADAVGRFFGGGRQRNTATNHQTRQSPAPGINEQKLYNYF